MMPQVTRWPGRLANLRGPCQPPGQLASLPNDSTWGADGKAASCRISQHATVLIGAAAIAGLAPLAATTAAAAPSAHSTVNAAASCRVTATIPVGGLPGPIAPDAKTNTVYTGNVAHGTGR